MAGFDPEFNNKAHSVFIRKALYIIHNAFKNKYY